MSSAPTAQTLKEIKRFLLAARVDISDVFERGELLERYRCVALAQRRRGIESEKLKANAACKRGSFELAVRLYTSALRSLIHTAAAMSMDEAEACALVAPLLSNRSHAYLKLALVREAATDARRCVDLEPMFLKGYHRLAAACAALGRSAEVAGEIERALRLPLADAQRVELTQLLDNTRAAAAAAATAAAASADADGVGASGERRLPPGVDQFVEVDFHVLLRERRRHAHRWGTGAHYVSWLGSGSDAHAGPVYGVQLRDETLVTSSEDAKVKVWDLARSSVTHTFCGHSHGILGVWLDPKPESQRVLSGGFDADLRMWDLDGTAGPGRCVCVMVGHCGPIVSVEANDDTIVSTSFDGTLRCWSWAGKQTASMPAHEGHSSGLALNDSMAYTGGDDGVVKAWDLSGERCTDTFEGGHQGSVWAVTCDGHGLVSAATDGSLCLWDLRMRRVGERLARAHEDAVPGLRLDEDKIVTSSFDSRVKVWDRRKLGTPVVMMAPHAPLATRCTRLAFDDTRIITGTLNGGILVLDLV